MLMRDVIDSASQGVTAQLSDYLISWLPLRCGDSPTKKEHSTACVLKRFEAISLELHRVQFCNMRQHLTVLLNKVILHFVK